MIITIGNTKGGVGKSTISCNLAVAAAQDGKSVLIVDADVQASSMGFRSIREADDIKATAITTATLHKDLKDFNFDWIIIDAGGRDSAVFRSAVLACECLIVPVLPSVYDIWATSDTLKIIEEAQVYNETIKARILLNMLMPNTIMARETTKALEEQTDKILPMDSRLHSRVAFKNSLMRGLGVLEHDPKSKAAKELKAVYEEIKNFGV